MSALPSHIQGYRETMAANEATAGERGEGLGRGRSSISERSTN